MPNKLLHGHAVFREKFFQERAFLGRLAKKQEPGALYIGCSDSRVVPEFLTNANPGELFVLRNIANFVPAQPDSDVSVGAAVEYAVQVLKVTDIVVCGHYGCGGVKAAVEGLQGLNPTSELATWLTGVLPAAHKARDKKLEGDALWRGAVEENVLDAVANLITFPCVKDALEAGSLHLHGWVYDMATGALKVWDETKDQFVDPHSLTT